MTRKPPASTPPDKPRKTARANTGEDKALWQHVASSVTPLKARHKKAARDTAKNDAPAAPTSKTAAKPVKKTKPEKQATPQRSTLTRSAPTAPAPQVRKSGGGFDRATETKLRKGQLDIEGRIDLHGMTQDEAWAALTRFVTRAHTQRKRTVLVITGKGRLSQGGGVLRRLLPLWVREGSLAICVLACVPAAAKDGGDGAFYLRLKKSN